MWICISLKILLSLSLLSYSVQGTLPVGVKLHNKLGTGDPTVVMPNSDFNRTTVKTATFNGFDAAGNAQMLRQDLISFLS